MAKRGRKKGSQSKGYYHRTGRGWFATGSGPLFGDDGKPLKDRSTPAKILQAAYARHLLDQQGESFTDDPTLIEVCQAYLDHCKGNGADRTYESRAGTLFDFCCGLPAGLREKDVPKHEREAARIHKGYGALRASQLKPLHVDRWLASHPTWKGSRRTRVQALRRALNYGKESGLIAANPIKGYKVAKSRPRVTYLTPEQERACYKHANEAVAMAIKVCVRTGARYGCEFAKLTAKHVTLSDKGMEWTFQPHESKNGKLRVIRIPKTEPVASQVITTVKKQMKRYPQGPIFRTTTGQPWSQSYLGQKIRDVFSKIGVQLDDDSCPYMLRHTYAKRTLGGYWTGKLCTIEALAGLMGNSRQVCWEHYAIWCDAYTDPLWESA